MEIEDQPMTIEENDNISLGMQHCFFEIDNDSIEGDELNIFNAEYDQNELVYYSQHEINEYEMKDDYEAYFSNE